MSTDPEPVDSQVQVENLTPMVPEDADADPETGSAAWLRDLADRLQQYGEFIGMADPEVFTTTPRAIRSYADKTERQAARDARDRERVETIVVRQLVESTNAAAERLAEMVGSHASSAFGANEFDARAFWDGLPAEDREKALAPALELYRAGRDDQEADRA